MTQERIAAFVHELGEMLSHYEQHQQQVAKLDAQNNLVKKMARPEQAMQIANAIAEATTMQDQMLAAIVERTSRRTVTDAITLYEDIKVRLQSATRLFSEWRKVEAAVELGIATGEISAEERAEATTNIERHRKLYETQLELAANLVPTTSNVLATAAALPTGTPMLVGV